MKFVLSTCIFAGLSLFVAGAPSIPEGQQTISRQEIEEYLRNRRSAYGTQYISPCAMANSMSPVSGAAYQLDSTYHAPVRPHYAYGAPHYRSIDEQLADSEMLRFSDFDQFAPEHIPMARLGGYGAASASMASSIPAINPVVPATTATVYGVFPNANVGGYSVPLLFSCSPTVVPGHMMEAQSAATSVVPAPDLYRGVDDHDHHQHHEELSSQEHLSTVHEPSKVAPHTS